MKVFDVVKHNKYSCRLFVEFMQSKGYDVTKILTNDNRLEALCYYIEFLSSQQVYITVDHRAYVVYKQFDELNQLIIECQESDKDIITRYVLGVINAFNYIENPF